GSLYFNEADTVRAGRRPEQVLAGFMVPVRAIVDDLENEIRRRDQRRPGQIERRRGVLGRKPVIAGTRIPVDSVRRLVEDGMSEEEILEQYPDLTAVDVAAALKEAPPRRRARRAS